MVTLVATVIALALAYLLGAHRARESERRRFARGQLQKFEADLIRQRGRRVHPDPNAAAVISRIRFQRIR
jgi:hypothetical protein